MIRLTETELCNLKEEYREYEENSFLLTSEEREVQALNMAMETIERMSGNIHLQVGRKLQIRTSQILSEITDGEYQDVQMDAASHMTVTTGNGAETLECLSRGTLELFYFAMRMAAGELHIMSLLLIPGFKTAGNDTNSSINQGRLKIAPFNKVISCARFQPQKIRHFRN